MSLSLRNAQLSSARSSTSLLLNFDMYLVDAAKRFVYACKLGQYSEYVENLAPGMEVPC